MLLLGGYIWDSGSQSGIWELKNDEWTRLGELKEVNKKKIKIDLLLNFRACTVDLRFILADPFIYFRDTLLHIQSSGSIWATKKSSRTLKSLETIQNNTSTLSSSKPPPISAFDLFCLFSRFPIFTFMKTKMPFSCYVAPNTFLLIISSRPADLEFGPFGHFKT